MGGTSVRVEADRPLAGHVASQRLSNPNRFIVDINGFSRAPGVSDGTRLAPPLGRYRVGRHPSKVRIVFDLAAPIDPTVKMDGNKLVIKQ